ncbi:glutathione S-transferase-like protein [Tanacetum coccineum]
MEDPSKLAIQTVWMDVENQRFDLPFMKLLEIAMQGTHSQEAGHEYEKAMFNVLDVYEARLKKSNYLGGDSFNMADLYHLPGVHFLRATKVKGWFQGRPHVRDWSANILSRPAWVKVAAIFTPESQSGVSSFNGSDDFCDVAEPKKHGEDRGSGYHQKDRKPSQNDKTEHGMEKTVQNQGQSPKMPKSESILKNQQSNRSRN